MKLTKLVQNGIMAGNAFAPSKKEWVQFIPVALSVASSLIGGHKAAQAAREAKKEQDIGRARNNAWYLRARNQHYLDTDAGQNLLRKAAEHIISQNKRAAGATKVGGGTEAGEAMAKEAGNKMMGDTIANIAAADSQRKDRIDAIHHQDENRETQMNINRELNRAQNITNAAQNMSNAMMQTASVIDGAKSQANTSNVSLGGSSNGGTPAVLKGEDAYVYGGTIGNPEGRVWTSDEIDEFNRANGINTRRI